MEQNAYPTYDDFLEWDENDILTYPDELTEQEWNEMIHSNPEDWDLTAACAVYFQ
jgi:hypothetical protein